MKELLNDLKNEVLGLSMKNIGPVGFDYRRRTKLERLIFLILKDYCETKFNYNLGGLSYGHQKLFFDYAKNKSLNKQDIGVVKKAFEISDLITDLSSSDPYTVEDSIDKLGGSLKSVFDRISKEVNLFIKLVEESS